VIPAGTPVLRPGHRGRPQSGPTARASSQPASWVAPLPTSRTNELFHILLFLFFIQNFPEWVGAAEFAVYERGQDVGQQEKIKS